VDFLNIYLIFFTFIVKFLYYDDYESTNSYRKTCLQKPVSPATGILFDYIQSMKNWFIIQY
jgi:hypothetical protein